VHALVETPAQAEQAGRAFGEFQRLLADLPPPRLHETSADFHNTPARFEAFDRAWAADGCQRVRRATAEIEFARQHRPLADVLLDLQRRGAIPERVVHNDAKITNVLLDEDSGEALCIVDLDTVMPGLALNDFGDMVRSMTCPAPEDETDLARVVTYRLPERF
jgi:Ser/Thr protein kinase RdoA (MazF antagonist)